MKVRLQRREGEQHFLENLGFPGKVNGPVWCSGNEIVENPPRPFINDLDRLCTIQTSRGCPNQCAYCNIPTLAVRTWRNRSPEHVLGEMQHLNDEGYRSIYLTDDQFLLNRKRISEICRGIIDRKLKFTWGCEGRVDSVAADQFPIMDKANCTFLAFGVESGTQKVLDRLKKMQTLEQIKRTVGEAKRHGIGTTHDFFLIGSPGESVEDILESFRFEARLKLDTFGFNRPCVYRGTPLWKEYVERGIIDDARDWNKWFKCSDIDPTILPSRLVNRARQKGYMLLFAKRIFLRRFFHPFHAPIGFRDSRTGRYESRPGTSLMGQRH
jgi:radical SAM superfamily enzyme YgiQ (UPF0313 family)